MDFWKLEEFWCFWILSKFLEFPKSETGVGIFGFWEFWKLEEFWVFLDFEQIPRVSKTPKLGLGFLDFWIFGNSRNFGFFDFEQIPRVSKIPNLGVDFLEFWNFGNSKNLLDFWILRLPLEFPKIQTFGVDVWMFGFLDF